MRPERALVTERPAARHKLELLRSGPAADSVPPQLALGCERMSRALAAEFGRFAGGDAPAVVCAEPRTCTIADLAKDIAPLAANSLLAVGLTAAPLLATIEAAVVLRLVDRTFGGRGLVPDPLPSAFPLSAELLIQRLEAIVASACVMALPGCPDIRALQRDGKLAQVVPFAADEPLTVLVFSVTETDTAPWTVTLALPANTLASLIGPTQLAAPRRRPSDPLSQPFGDMPLSVRAVLVDMSVPFSRISDLQPGDVLPVSVARSVPLQVGDQVIASGTIGAMDDRVAVQLTQVFS